MKKRRDTARGGNRKGEVGGARRRTGKERRHCKERGLERRRSGEGQQGKGTRNGEGVRWWARD
jgi:hypothetical protein